MYKFKNVRKVVAVSKEIEKILNNEYGIKNTSVIYNPVDFKNNENVKDLDEFKPFILGVGRLHPQKNFEMLIRAFAKINFDSNLKLIILGEGILRHNLTNLIESLNLQERVFLLGNVSNVIDYYKQCEFFVLSSLFEGFPNVLIEALSNGCACISTDCPTGPNEIIKDSINGLLVDNNNQTSLENAMTKLLENGMLKNALKSNSKKSVENLNIKNISKRWLLL